MPEGLRLGHTTDEHFAPPAADPVLFEAFARNRRDVLDDNN